LDKLDQEGPIIPEVYSFCISKRLR